MGPGSGRKTISQLWLSTFHAGKMDVVDSGFSTSCRCELRASICSEKENGEDHAKRAFRQLSE
jgi:hypothetical protein